MPPKWIKPQLTRLVEEAPAGPGRVDEIKYDGYQMHARIDGGKAVLLTRTGLDWSRRYRRTVEALQRLPVTSAYVDGELCALNAEGVPVFSRLQAAMDEGRTDQLVYVAFDLLFIDGDDIASLPAKYRYSERYWRDRADEARALGDDVRDPTARESLERLARMVERMARQAAERTDKSN